MGKFFSSSFFFSDATRDKILVEEQSRAQESLKRRMDKLRQSIQEANQAVALERKKNVDLLYLIFPPLIAQRLWLGQPVEAQTCDEVTVLFSDIVGFTSICSTATPIMVINMLNELYTRFDQFCGEIDVYKVRKDTFLFFNDSIEGLIWLLHFFFYPLLPSTFFFFSL